MLSVVLLAGGLIALAVSRTVTQAMGDEYKKRGQALALNLAARCQNPLLAVDFLRLKDMVDETLGSSDGVVYAFIMDAHNEILAHTYEGGFPTALKTANGVERRESCRIRLLDTGQERIYDFAAPVLADANLVGTVRLGLSRTQVARTIRQIIWDIFSQLALALFAATLVGFSLANSVTRRVSRLRSALGRVNAGHLDIRISPPIERPCWQVKACHEKTCPLYGDSHRRCWAARAWMRSGDADCDTHAAACQSCTMYRRHAGDEIQQLAEAFEVMLHSLDGSVRQLAESKRVLEASEWKHRRIFETSMDMIFIADASGTLQDINPTGRNLLGLPQGALPLDPLRIEALFADPEEFAELDRRLQRDGYIKDWETVLCPAGQKPLDVLFSCSLQRNVAGQIEAYEGIVKDISLRKTIEKQLLRADRLASLGQLSSGVAHEINNPLGLILGYAQLLLRDAPASSQQHADLKIIEEETLKCKTVVQALLNFARKTETRLAPVCLNELIEEVAAIVRHDFEMMHIALEIACPAAVPDAFGDAEKLRQVLVNLLINARQAVGADGLVRVTATHWPERGTVGFVVEDSGPGIAPEHIEQIFDPFFTTKPVGQGTGLGLSVSYGIVQEHGGHIQVVSDPGRMTAFTVELPQTPDDLPKGEKAQ